MFKEREEMTWNQVKLTSGIHDTFNLQKRTYFHMG